MRRQRVGGLDDGDLPVEEEQEMQIPIAYQYATVATVDGHRVARILGIDDVMSVERDEGHYNGVIHFAVLRSCLNEASSLLNRLGRIKRGQSLRISNLAALLQARVLQYGLSRLSLDLSDLHEGLRRNTIIWQLAHDIRARPIPPFQLQPVILGERIVVLFDAIRGTLDRFPKEPAGRHAGPNTTPAPAPLVCTDLVRRVDAHIGAIGDLLAMQLDYPDISLAMYNSRVVEQLLEEEEHFRPIRGLDHLKLLLAMPTMSPLTEFCVSQLYLGDASDMLQRLRAAQEPPKMYIFANLDRVQSATAVRETFITINQHLQIIANGLEHGLIEWDNIKSLDTIHNKFLLPAMGQGAAFRGAAQEFEAELLNFLDHPEMPQDLTAPGGPQHAGLVPALRPLVNRLLGSVGALWGTSIEYPDKKSPEVLVPKEGTNRPDY